MVYFFTSNVVDPPATIYVGKDKFENEELIKFGWDCDFHADNLSSAHIYLRLTTATASDGHNHHHHGEEEERQEQQWQWDALPKELLEDCAQLTKANSIEGNKKDNVTIIYTPWTNLRKDASMATGQVGFVDPKKVKKTLIPTRLNPPLNRLQKTRLTLPASALPADKDAYISRQRARKRAEGERRRKEEERAVRERREEKEGRERGWEELMRGEGGEGGGGGKRSNVEGFDEEDFM